jgi:hypothetical protein
MRDGALPHNVLRVVVTWRFSKKSRRLFRWQSRTCITQKTLESRAPTYKILFLLLDPSPDHLIWASAGGRYRSRFTVKLAFVAREALCHARGRIHFTLAGNLYTVLKGMFNFMLARAQSTLLAGNNISPL